jgi:hypothetical protein
LKAPEVWEETTPGLSELHAVEGSPVTLSCPPEQLPSGSYQPANWVELPMVTEAEAGVMAKLGEQEVFVALHVAVLPLFEPVQLHVHVAPEAETVGSVAV